MELHFETYITVGDENNYDKKLFTVDYDPSREDLDEFAKECGYKDIEDLVNQKWQIDDKYDEESKQICLDDIKQGKFFLVPTDLEYILDLGEELERFLVKKYQTKFEEQLLHKLVLDDSEFEF